MAQSSPVRELSWQDIISKETNWITCQKCGDRPRGQPAMACSKCKTVHGDWKPNPLGLLIAVDQKKYKAERELGVAQKEVGELRTRQSNLQAQAADLDKQVAEARGLQTKTECEAKEAELRVIRQGPATKAKADAMFKQDLDSVQEFTQQLTSLVTRRDAVLASIAAEEAEVAKLKEACSALETETAAMKLQYHTMSDLLLDAVRGGGSGKAQEIKPPAGISPEVWALVQRAQQQQQGQGMMMTPMGMQYTNSMVGFQQPTMVGMGVQPVSTVGVVTAAVPVMTTQSVLVPQMQMQVVQQPVMGMMQQPMMNTGMGMGMMNTGMGMMNTGMGMGMMNTGMGMGMMNTGMGMGMMNTGMMQQPMMQQPMMNMGMMPSGGGLSAVPLPLGTLVR